MVTIQATTTSPATPQRTALARLATPAPITHPVIVCVVDTGMPSSDAVIHQGSVNPMMTAAGLPQLVLGLADDQVEMGRRFALGGSAVSLPGLTADRSRIREAVATLLTDDRLRDAAKRIQAEALTRPSVTHLVPLLERLARTGELTAADLPSTAPRSDEARMSTR